MKYVFVMLAVLTLVGCSAKNEPVTTTSPDITFSPVFPDGSQMYSTDHGATWQKMPTLSKLMGCGCDCSMNAAGVHGGSCGYPTNDMSCEEYCRSGGRR